MAFDKNQRTASERRFVSLRDKTILSIIRTPSSLPFLSDSSKILPAYDGTCAQHQRELTEASKGRQIALLPM